MKDSAAHSLFSPSSIRSQIKQANEPAAKAEPDHGGDEADKLIPLPQPGDEYKAHARAANKPVLTLRFLTADASIRGFPYANLDGIDLVPADRPDDGPAIVVRFAGIAVTEVKIEGRHLDTLYDQIGHHRVGWVRELPPRRDFKDAGEVVITRIAIRTLES
jgi:hypothetical protein